MIETMTATERKPWVAAVLSLFCTGLGHIYCGRVVAGLVLFLASLLFAPLVVVTALVDPSTPVLAVLLGGLIAVLGVYIFAVIDACRTCRRLEGPYEPRDVNHGLIYALFLLVGVTYPLGVLHYLRANYFEAFFIPAGSMAPNLLNGDRVLVNKVALRGKAPRRGDVVVFRRPNDRSLIFVKRVIGLPGDTVEVRSGRVILNGKELERDQIPRAALDAVVRPEDGKVFSESNAGRRYLILQRSSPEPKGDYPRHEVPEDTCFVLGDNRDNSLDSRQFGFVPLGDIVGVVQYNYYPAVQWSRFGAFRDY